MVDRTHLRQGEYIAMGGGLLLLIGLFLTWYHVDQRASLHGTTGDFSGWSTLCALAPFILAWIIARDHALSWPRGEMTAVTAIAALGLLAWVGLIDRPGDPRSLIHLRFGWFLAVIGAAMMLVGAVMRTQETETRRKPPGTI